MRFLIVNADDFGASRGINRGILEAARAGVVTSASLLVNSPWSEEAALLSRAAPGLSVGLHADLTRSQRGLASDSPASDSLGHLDFELRGQLTRFEKLMGRLPTHVDSHHNVHRDPRLLPCFLRLAQEYGLPLREHSPVRYFSKFYGQWGGETHLEQISAGNLVRMFDTEIEEGVTELSCHPGYVDPDYPTGYAAEREAELRTLCAPRIRQALAERSIQLVSYHDLAKFVGNAPT